jgi:hypothetical protein
VFVLGAANVGNSAFLCAMLKERSRWGAGWLRLLLLLLLLL